MTGTDDAEALLSPRERLLRTVGLWAGVALATVLVGALIGNLLVAGGRKASPRATISRLTPAVVGSVLLVPGGSPAEPDDPLRMGSKAAGVSVVGIDEVDDVRTSEGRRRAPDGGRLVLFELGDGPCETKPCGAWRTLAPKLVVDGVENELPAGGGTFAVVLPPGAAEVELALDADGFAQHLSLVGDPAGDANIALLSGPHPEGRTAINKTVRLTEETSIALTDGAGPERNLFYRNAVVEYSSLHFFLDGTAPSSPRRAFLAVNAYYSYVGKAAKYVFGTSEAAFVTADGTRYPGLDLDPSADIALLGFEVPASTRSGTLVLGGSNDKISTTGQPYVSTLQNVEIPIKVGPDVEPVKTP